jgi:hypothetical protein
LQYDGIKVKTQPSSSLLYLAMSLETPASEGNDSSGRDVEGVNHETEEYKIGDMTGQVSFREDEVKTPRASKRLSMFVASESFINDSQSHLFEKSYHPEILRAYNPPKQRQRWVRRILNCLRLDLLSLLSLTFATLQGDKRVLPRVNWGDLFFDLFYVAATYNVR